MHKIGIILDFGEFLIAISITAQQDPKKKLEWAFSMYGTYHESHLTDTAILLFIRYWSQWIHREERNEENHGCKWSRSSASTLYFILLFPKSIYDLLGEEKRGSNSPDNKVDQIFSKMDVNSDQKLSKDEFVSGCLQDDYLRKLLAPSAS